MGSGASKAYRHPAPDSLSQASEVLPLGRLNQRQSSKLTSRLRRRSDDGTGTRVDRLAGNSVISTHCSDAARWEAESLLFIANGLSAVLFEPLRDLMFFSTTKFGRTKEDEDQKPYPVLPHRSSPSLVSFPYTDLPR
jgi:hypothetical protein